MSQPPAKSELLDAAGLRLVSQLAQRVSQIEGRRPPLAAECVSTGCPGLDEALPAGGLQRGTLVEWLAARAGSGAATLALLAAAQAAQAGGAVVVVDRHRGFYPPAALSWGLAPEQLILVRPAALADERWALDQVLRSEGVAALLAWPERLDDREFRRLQLAAETSGVLGLLVRPLQARDEPSWADLRLLVEPLSAPPACDANQSAPAAASPQVASSIAKDWAASDWAAIGLPTRRLRIEILRARGNLAGRREIELTLTEQRGVLYAEASSLRVAARLAAGTTGRGARGA